MKCVGDYADITVPVHLAYCALVSTLRHHVARKTSHLAVLQVEADAIDSYMEAGKLYLRQVLSRRGYAEPFVWEIQPPRKGKTSDRAVYRRAAEDGKGMMICSSLDHVEEELKLFADIVTVLPKPTSRQLTATFRRFGHILTKSEEGLVASETWTRLVYAFQPDRPVAAGLRRLRETAKEPQAQKLNPTAVGPTLTDLSGLGDARDWGFDLARDLADFQSGVISWDDVDSGALISGPPGTGKTLFAAALARTCNVPIVTASAAQWQATGYLNDLLGAMRDSFREAQSYGTAILFVDELDAVGSREISDSQHADYKRQVINCFLELLDGFNRRCGVVVVGATNHPGNLDPAILRPGRLDRHFAIPLPDTRSREQIFAFHAGFSVPEAHQTYFGRSTIGMSGAAIKQLVKDARRAARRREKSFGFEDVLRVAKPLIPLPADQMRLAAFHEAGHAIVGLDLGMSLERVNIADTLVDGTVNFLGGVLFTQQPFVMKTRTYFLDQIAMYLGGLAAEVVVYGEFTESVADNYASDLALATALATRLEGCFGMGKTLMIDIVHDRELARLRANDFRLRAAVSEVLDQQFARAKTMLRLRIHALQDIADTLVRTKSMTEASVKEVLSRHPVNTADKSGVDTSDRANPSSPSCHHTHSLSKEDVGGEVDASWGVEGQVNAYGFQNGGHPVTAQEAHS